MTSPSETIPPAPEQLEVRQSGALPYAYINGNLHFLIVTTRRSGRWIFPKGGVKQGYTPWDSAACEAEEEAGVGGEISDLPIGAYQARVGSDALLVTVDIYPLEVTRQYDQWREKGQRLRHWATLTEAQRLLGEPVLCDLAEKLARQLSSGGRAAGLDMDDPKPLSRRI
ncbi:NUDIX domain-containing protein [Devosia sp. Leaf64]|uniref:NUDIX hydrolase n=1 Tax=Devosia sp. Leaf64 TaxID=1736229 RepID=UPI000713007C|nr:NUDIX domain-containing protein [Devosia sp. Leaf64]KQN70116.1 hypothetical protein ASE94_13700 [Devosia sp. Leaf64]